MEIMYHVNIHKKISSTKNDRFEKLSLGIFDLGIYFFQNGYILVPYQILRSKSPPF